MTDLARLVAFLAGCGLPYEIQKAHDVLMLPVDDIAYVNYATKVECSVLVGYFAADGSLAGLSSPGPTALVGCAAWDPTMHEPSGLVVCRNCGGSEGLHEND